jgi:hypothetical protein
VQIAQFDAAANAICPVHDPISKQL